MSRNDRFCSVFGKVHHARPAAGNARLSKRIILTRRRRVISHCRKSVKMKQSLAKTSGKTEIGSFVFHSAPMRSKNRAVVDHNTSLLSQKHLHRSIQLPSAFLYPHICVRLRVRFPASHQGKCQCPWPVRSVLSFLAQVTPVRAMPSPCGCPELKLPGWSAGRRRSAPRSPTRFRFRDIVPIAAGSWPS